MKTFWNSICLIALSLSFIACTQQEVVPQGEGSAQIAEQTSDQGQPKTEPTQVPEGPVTFPVELETAFLDHAKLLHPNWNNLDSDEQLEILQGIRETWHEEMGALLPNTMSHNLININKFFQFVRLTGGIGFWNRNFESAKANYFSHLLLDKILEIEDPSQAPPVILGMFLTLITKQNGLNSYLRHHILDVAQIYSVQILPAAPTAEEDSMISEEIGNQIAAKLNLDSVQTTTVKDALKHLLLTTTFKIISSNQHVSFLGFVLYPKDELPLPEVFGIEYYDMVRIYGAIETSGNSFVK